MTQELSFRDIANKKQIVLGVPVDDVDLREALSRLGTWFREDKQRLVVTPNPEFLLAARADREFAEILWRADLALPDGFGLLPASWVIGDRLRHRVTGVDFTEASLELCARHGYRAFFFGGRGEVAKVAAEKMRQRFPGLKIDWHEGPRDALTPTVEERRAVEQAIHNFRPAVLFVGFGQVKQEKWLKRNMPQFKNVKVGIGVGGTFDYLSGVVPRAPRLLRTLGLEWLYRLWTQPRMRWPRIWRAVFVFPLAVLIFKWHIHFRYRRSAVALILDADGKRALIVERADQPGHWQLPQGGIEKDETTERAVLREMREELGTDKFKIIGIKRNIYRYTWGDKSSTSSYRTRMINGYRGQRQNLVVLKFTGADQDIKLEPWELANWRWVTLDKLIDSVHAVRRPMTTKSLGFYKDLTSR